MEETDMVTALRTADEQDIPYACIDRDYVVTQERLVEECTPIELIPVVVALLGMYLTPRFFGDDAEALEKEIRVSRAQFAEQSAKERLIRRILGHVVATPTRVIRDERDVYMADKLNELHDGNTIVAVIGGAHWKGVVRELRSRGIDPITVWPSAEEE